MLTTTKEQQLYNEQHLSGYDLTTNLIRGGIGKLQLTPNTKLVLLYLSTCYNERNGVVFPKIKTIAESIGISELSVKRAIAELIKSGCILKAKRYKNSNQYVITGKVLNNAQNDTSTVQDDTFKKYQNDTTHVHEVKEHEVKEQQIKNVVSLKKSFNNEVPEQVRQYLTSKGITNPAGYWRSAVNGGYADDLINKAKAEAEKQERIRRNQELLRQEEIQKAQERQKFKEEMSKPLTEQWTKEQAIQYIYNSRILIKKLGHSAIAEDLARAFNLNIEEIITTSKEK